MGRVQNIKHHRHQGIMEQSSNESTRTFPAYPHLDLDSVSQTRSYLVDEGLIDSNESDSSSSDDTTESDLESWLPISEELGRISERSSENEKQPAPQKTIATRNNKQSTSTCKKVKDLPTKRFLKQTKILESQNNLKAQLRSEPVITLKKGKKVDDEPKEFIMKKKDFGYDKAQSKSRIPKVQPPTQTLANVTLVDTSTPIPPPALNTEAGPPFVCDVAQCQQIFKTLQTLTKHQSSHADTNRLFVCPFCTQRFFYLKTLKRHCSMKHKDLKYAIPNDTYTCEICGKKLEQPGLLKKHVQNHNDMSKKFACPICKQRFQAYKSLALHLTLLHPNTVTNRNYGINLKRMMSNCKLDCKTSERRRYTVCFRSSASQGLNIPKD